MVLHKSQFHGSAANTVKIHLFLGTFPAIINHSSGKIERLFACHLNLGLFNAISNGWFEINVVTNLFVKVCINLPDYSLFFRKAKFMKISTILFSPQCVKFTELWSLDFATFSISVCRWWIINGKYMNINRGYEVKRMISNAHCFFIYQNLLRLIREHSLSQAIMAQFTDTYIYPRPACKIYQFQYTSNIPFDVFQWPLLSTFCIGVFDKQIRIVVKISPMIFGRVYPVFILPHISFGTGKNHKTGLLAF